MRDKGMCFIPNTLWEPSLELGVCLYRCAMHGNKSIFFFANGKTCKFDYYTNISTGLQTSENSKFYAISSRFKPFSNKGKTLVIQYTVKHEQKIDCGGGYIKIFSSDLDQKNLRGDSRYYIMFGELIVIS